MPKFDYEAKNPQGAIIKGEISAKSEKDVEKVLWQNKLAVVSVTTKKGGLLKTNIYSRITTKDRAIFARQVATMLKAGFPLLQCLSVIVLQTQNEKFKDMINEMIQYLEEGKAFSVALSSQPKIFASVYINIVRTGEASGNLPKVMDEIATDIEKEAALISKIRGAMYYPAFIFVTLIGVVGLMMIKVIPQLKTIFEDAGVRLPWTTRSVIWVSNFLVQWWWLTLIVIIGLIIFLKFYTGKTKTGRKQYDTLKIKIPLFKELIKNIYMLRFARTFGLLSLTGVPILESIKITSRVIGNVVYENELMNVYHDVERGIPLSVPLSKNSKLFPAMVAQMISVGEKTGNMGKILHSLTGYYEEEVDRQIKSFSSLLEPILIVVIGIGVAIMVFSVIVPIYQIAQINI